MATNDKRNEILDFFRSICDDMKVTVKNCTGENLRNYRVRKEYTNIDSSWLSWIYTCKSTDRLEEFYVKYHPAEHGEEAFLAAFKDESGCCIKLTDHNIEAIQELGILEAVTCERDVYSQIKFCVQKVADYINAERRKSTYDPYGHMKVSFRDIYKVFSRIRSALNFSDTRNMSTPEDDITASTDVHGNINKITFRSKTAVINIDGRGPTYIHIVTVNNLGIMEITTEICPVQEISTNLIDTENLMRVINRSFQNHATSSNVSIYWLYSELEDVFASIDESYLLISGYVITKLPNAYIISYKGDVMKVTKSEKVFLTDSGDTNG